MHPALAKFKARVPARSDLIGVLPYVISLFFAYLAAVPEEHQQVLAALSYLMGIGMLIGAAAGYCHAVVSHHGADALMKSFPVMKAG